MSYTCCARFADQQLPDGRLWLDGHGTAMTGNLYNALGRLRRPDHSRDIWVDAVCIDQSNSAERTAQVSIMADIYRAASDVCIWLGEDSEEQDGRCIFEGLTIRDSVLCMNTYKDGQSVII